MITLIEIFRASAILALAWLFLLWKKKIQQRCLTNGVIEKGRIFILGRIATIVIVFFALLLTLHTFGLDVFPLLAFGGIGAAAAGLAGQDIIANFFSGTMLILTRPFVVGEEICLSHQNIEGVVEEIGWYLTLIRDKNKRRVYLPNAIFSKEVVVNISRMSHQKIEETFRVRREDMEKMKPFFEKLRKEIAAHPEIDQKMPVLVVLQTLGDYFLEIYIEAYSVVTEWELFLAVKQEILEKIEQEIQVAELIPNISLSLPAMVALSERREHF